MKNMSAPKMTYDLQEGRFDTISDLRTDGISFRDEECTQVFSDHSFFECTFVNVSFPESMRSCQFVDCIFDHCDFSNRDFRETVFRRVQIRSCRMTGTDLSDSRLQDTEMKGVQARYGSFGGSRWKRCRLEECSFVQGSLSYCEFEKTEISRCDFSEAELLGTKLAGLDFSDSRIDGFMIQAENLKGVIMNEEQALACTKLLGIRIKND